MTLPLNSVLVDEPGKWCGRVIGWRQDLYDQLREQLTQEEVAALNIEKLAVNDDYNAMRRRGIQGTCSNCGKETTVKPFRGSALRCVRCSVRPHGEQP